MARTLTEKILRSHAQTDGGSDEVALHIDQTLTQDATGTLVMLALEAMGLAAVKTELSAQYVDHNLLQQDARNADDHLFLESACQRFGVWFSRPGNGVSHPLHMQLFGRPGATLLGSDSHTCAAGSLGMLAIGAGGMEVAQAMAGNLYWLRRPKVWGVRLAGALRPWVSAKDVILEMLRRYGVDGSTGYVIEYYGPGVESLSAMDRHVICNMGAELGATTSLFPSDAETARFLSAYGRGDCYQALKADAGAAYDRQSEIDLDEVVPLIAMPSSPGNVVAVREVSGRPIYQSYVGSSANPGYRDFAIVAEMVRGRRVVQGVSLDINPTTRGLLEDLAESGQLGALLEAGARLHQAGCNGCIGMGQAPATGRNSLRTTPRNFPGRSGTAEDSVWLCSPETAAASALTGYITDPRDLAIDYPSERIAEPQRPRTTRRSLDEPPSTIARRSVELVKGPNIKSIPKTDPVPEALDAVVLLRVGDDVSTDEILPAGAKVLPLRSNVPEIAKHCFEPIDASYSTRAAEQGGAHAIVGGDNYGQGSSREHAALAPAYLGLRLVLAKSFSRIHENNLVNFGVLPLRYGSADEAPDLGDEVRVDDVAALLDNKKGRVVVAGKGELDVWHTLTDHQVSVLRAGGLIAMNASS